MRSFYRKAVAAVTAVICFSMAVPGCSANKVKDLSDSPRASNAVIKEDDPWYSGRTLELSKVIGESDMIHDVDDPIMVGDLIFESVYSTQYDGSRYGEDLVFYAIDLDGVIVDQISAYGGKIDDSRVIRVSGASRDGDDILIYSIDFSKTLKKYVLCETRWDLKAHKLSEPKELDIGLEDGEFGSYCSTVDGNIIICTVSPDGSQAVRVVKDWKLQSACEVNNDGGEITWTSAFVKDGKLELNGVRTRGSDYAAVKFKVVIGDSKGEMSETNKIDASSSVTGYDGRNYSAGQDGIYADGEMYLSFDDTDADIMGTNSISVVSIDEDRIILSGRSVSMTDPGLFRKMMILDRQDKNPNAGKTVITSMSCGSLDGNLRQAIIDYNRGDHQYFVRNSIRDVFDLESYDDAALEKFNNDFRMSVLSNEGPDIIFNANGIENLINEHCLMDMSDMIELDPEKYYTNITDLAKTDGKQLLLPLSFRLYGIAAESEAVSEDLKGFTYAQYKAFVKEVCNGEDPVLNNKIGWDPSYYLTFSMLPLGGDVINEGKADFDKESFKALADYFKDNVPIKENEDESGMFVFSAFGSNDPQLLFASSYEEFAMVTESYKNVRLLGLPSYSGCGPTAEIVSSVSISAATGMQKGCADFISTALSNDSLVCSDSFVIGREAQKLIADEAFDKALKDYEDAVEPYGADGVARAEADGYLKPSEEAKDRLIGQIDNVGALDTLDFEVLTIAKEELLPYLSGQKDWESVVKTINNRVQLYLNEQ